MDNDQHGRFILGFTLLSLAGLVAGIFLLATGRVTTSDWVSFGVMWCVGGLGISTGYHRLLTHRSFVTPRWLRYAFTVAGAMAGQGPPITWVAHHRRHHRDADKPGDPHSPYYVDEPARGWTGKSFWHSHFAWLLNEKLTSDPIRYCPDLLRDHGIRFISNHFVLFVVGGLLLGGAIGGVVAWSIRGFLTGMLWGGLIRFCLGNHLTYAVNSVGHTLGSRRFMTTDESRNVAWLAIPTFGEAWHNNHHAVPRSAHHGMRFYEIDISAMVIWALEQVGLATEVVRVDRATQERLIATFAKRNQPGGRSVPSVPARPLASLKGPVTQQVTDVE